MENETWATIPFAPNYAVSDHGRVKRLTGGSGVRAGRILKLGYSRGYAHVSLYYDGKSVTKDVHALVAICFLGPIPSPSHELAHNDGIRANCKASNLRWATRKENIADQSIHGTSSVGTRNGRALLTEENVRYIRSYPRDYGSRQKLAKELGVSVRVIDKVRSGESWRCVVD